MTTFDPHSIFALSKIINVVSQGSNTLIVDVTPGEGALFAINQQVTIATLSLNAPFPFMGNAMVARLTGIATDRLTIDYSSGNREGTNVHTAINGDYISNSITPKIFTDIESAVNAGAAVWGNITGTLGNQTDLQTTLSGKEDLLGYTPEDVANKTTDGTLSADSDTLYPSEKAVKTYVDAHAGGGVTQVGFTQFIGAIIGATDNTILNNATLDGSLINTFLSQPDTTRRLRFNTSAVGAMLTVFGIDYNGINISEDLDMSALQSIETIRAYKQIGSVQTNSVSGQTLSIGISESLGISRALPMAYLHPGGGFFDNGVFIVGISNPIDIFDPHEISKNVFHWEMYPMHSDFKVYFQFFDIFDHQF